MASYNSPKQFVFNFGDNIKKPNENCFPALSFPSSQNPLEEVGFHKQLSKTLDDFMENSKVGLPKTLGGLNEKGVNNQNLTPKSQKIKPPDVKRWASVVKAQKKFQPEHDLTDKQHSECTEITSDIFDCIFKTFPDSFESHKSFIVINDKMFYCNICSLCLDSVPGLSNHLKTRKHEDNAIGFFKSKMPGNLHYVMEFVSFYGSNLCCNLCRCKIPMSSHNPHETIVNIIAHNSSESHIKKKVNRETHNSAETILEELSQSSTIIMENMHIIERKLVPEFKCQLCKTLIVYDDNKEILTRHFTHHFLSEAHLKNQKAVEVLKLFGEASISGRENWAVVNGNIICTFCNREFETNLQQLISHASDVEHATNVLSKLGISSDFNKVSENNTLHENLVNEAKTIALNKSKREETDKKQTIETQSLAQSKPGSRLKELLSTMPTGLRDVDYVIENEKGSITCLICNRVVPPSTYNLRTHLLGNKHKINMELRSQVPVGESNKSVAGTSNHYPDSATTVKDINTTSASSKMSKNVPAAPNICKQICYVSKIDKDFLTCMICQCKIPNSNVLNDHLVSDEHKKRESLWLKNCPGCSSRNPFTNRLLTALPTSIRTYKCRQMETIPASVLNHLYSLLLKENQLIKQNENLLIKNVDGKHSYCKPCKTLIPLSLDMDILEKNLVSHLKEGRHERFLSRKSDNAQNASTSPKVARSLFDLPCDFLELKKDSNVFNFEDFSRLILKDAEMNVADKNCSFPSNVIACGIDSNLQELKKTECQRSEPEHNNSLIKKTDDVFIFGKEENDSLKEPKNVEETKRPNALPVADVTRLVKFEEESSEEVLTRRQKQIDYGKNTEGYIRYCKLVPRRKRSHQHPVTPPKHLRCSRRTWDGMIRAWRRQLHSWDPPSSTLDSDIRPLD